jgi:hypothetical protein
MCVDKNYIIQFWQIQRNCRYIVQNNLTYLQVECGIIKQGLD